MFSVRKINLSDLNFVKQCIDELESQCFPNTDFENIFSELLEVDWYYGFILNSNNYDCGYMGISLFKSLHHCGNAMEIQELIVLPEFRNKNIGKNALDFALKFANTKKAVILELASNKKRVDAHRFYKKNGFNESHFKFTYPILE